MKPNPDINDTMREEGDDAARERHDNAKKYNGQDSSYDRRFKFTPFELIKISTTPHHLIKDILPREGLVVVWGPAKCGKSFWVYDMTMHVALEWPYRDHKVRQGAVTYLALEGGAGFYARVEAWRQTHLQDHVGEVPFYLLTVPVDLIADHVGLIAAIGAQVPSPAVVVIDTLNRSLNGDENKSVDMANYIKAADAIRATFHCVVIVIHHCGIAGTRPRGHTSLAGADDAQIAVERDENSGIIIARVEFMKDGPPGAVVQSRLEGVTLGNDDDGDLITSCVIVPVEGEPTAKRREVTGQAKIALDLLKQALADHSQTAPPSNHIPPGSRTCPVDVWRRYCSTGMVTESDTEDTKSKAFRRAAEKLQALGIIGIWNGYVWLSDNRT